MNSEPRFAQSVHLLDLTAKATPSVQAIEPQAVGLFVSAPSSAWPMGSSPLGLSSSRSRSCARNARPSASALPLPSPNIITESSSGPLVALIPWGSAAFLGASVVGVAVVEVAVWNVSVGDLMSFMSEVGPEVVVLGGGAEVGEGLLTEGEEVGFAEVDSAAWVGRDGEEGSRSMSFASAMPDGEGICVALSVWERGRPLLPGGLPGGGGGKSSSGRRFSVSSSLTYSVEVQE